MRSAEGRAGGGRRGVFREAVSVMQGRNRAWLAASIVLLTAGHSGLVLAQEKAPMVGVPMLEARSILREASALVPAMEGSARSIAAANIASEQVRAGDVDAGALPTLHGSGSPHVGGVAYSLAKEGRLPMALQLIAKTPAGQEKAIAYWQIAQALLERAKFADAISAARLMSKDPAETGRSLDLLMQIYAAVWKAGDRKSASDILAEALSMVEREPKISPRMSRPMPTVWVFAHRPEMYRTIVHELALAGNRDGAQAVLARISAMAVKEPDSEKKRAIWGPLAEAQADVEDFAAARQTMELRKSDFFGEAILGAIAVEQARHGDVAGALATVADITGGLDRPALQEMSRMLSQSGDYAGARAAVEQMKGPGERAYGLADLAFQQVDKDPKGARSTAALAWSAAQESKDKAPSYVHQNAVKFVAATRARLGDVEAALEIINSPELRDKKWPLQNLVQFMTEAGKKDQALALARSQPVTEVRVYCLLTIASSLMDRIEAENRKDVVPQ
jgi:hypothetical protein